MKNSYKDSGVNIESADELVSNIGSITKSSNYNANIVGGIGGFGSMFSLENTTYQNPVLVSSTDGVGTKIFIAIESKVYNTIGIDLVAMCVNDIICHGAKPLFFLDYLATSRLDVEIATEIIKSIVEGCNIAGIPLVGGETAEMPGLYKESDFDIAGFTVGIVEKAKILPSKDIKIGDIVLGIKSSGFHSNGFSLIRKIFKDLKIEYNDNSIFTGLKWHEVLLKPTIIYTHILKYMPYIKGVAHITGGGITENFAPRVLSQNLKFEMSYQENDWPELFKWLKKEGSISYEEMLKTFNCGIGLAIVVEKQHASLMIESLKQEAVIIGTIA